jgi:uncharacterized protein with NRDE domain
MCLLLLALNRVPGRPWVLLGNRDEFHARPTAPAQAWNDARDIVGGRDLLAGGSWLALSRAGRYAAVTNVRTGSRQAAAQSRGTLVADFVLGKIAPRAYLNTVAVRAAEFGPFNLVVGDATGAGFLSSIDGLARPLDEGVHAFSNGSPEDEWPKMRRLRTALLTLIPDRKEHRAALRDRAAQFDAQLLDLLRDRSQPDDRDLPQTGVGMHLERLLGPVFIAGKDYGTRASTLAYARDDGGVVLRERRFGPDAVPLGESDWVFEPEEV